MRWTSGASKKKTHTHATGGRDEDRNSEIDSHSSSSATSVSVRRSYLPCMPRTLVVLLLSVPACYLSYHLSFSWSALSVNSFLALRAFQHILDFCNSLPGTHGVRACCQDSCAIRLMDRKRQANASPYRRRLSSSQTHWSASQILDPVIPEMSSMV